jgi:hypothetical protein
MKNEWTQQRTEALKLAETLTRELHAQFTFIEGYIAAHEKLVKEISYLKVELAFAKDKINQLQGRK